METDAYFKPWCTQSLSCKGSSPDITQPLTRTINEGIHCTHCIYKQHLHFQISYRVGRICNTRPRPQNQIMTTILSVQAVKIKSCPDKYVRCGRKITRNLQKKQPRWYQYQTWYILVLYSRTDNRGEPNHNQCWKNWSIIRLRTRTYHHFLGRQILASPPLWS